MPKGAFNTSVHTQECAWRPCTIGLQETKQIPPRVLLTGLRVPKEGSKFKKHPLTDKNTSKRQRDKIFMRCLCRWGGHVVRGTATHLQHLLWHRDMDWWQFQQTRPDGLRHEGWGVFRDQMGDGFCPVLRGLLEEHAMDREAWKKREDSFLNASMVSYGKTNQKGERDRVEEGEE